MNEQLTQIVLRDVQVPFRRLVVLTLQCTLASIPALVVLCVVGSFLVAALVEIFVVLRRVLGG